MKCACMYVKNVKDHTSRLKIKNCFTEKLEIELNKKN